MFFSQMHLSCFYRPLWVRHNTAISSCTQLTLQDKGDIIHTVERLVTPVSNFHFQLIIGKTAAQLSQLDEDQSAERETAG